MQIRMKLAAIVIAGAATAALAASPALAISQPSASKTITGPEIITGAVHGKRALLNAPTIPLRLLGVVSTRSRISLGGRGPRKGNTKTLRTRAGNLTLRVIRKPQNRQSFSSKTCRFSFSTDIRVTVVGSKSTGAFAGARGPGAVQVTFAARGPRFSSGPHKGQCNPRGRPRARGAVASFLGSLVLTVR